MAKRDDEITPEQYRQMHLDAIPAKRTFIVRRWKEELVSIGLAAPRLVEMQQSLVEIAVEAHQYTDTAAGSLGFTVMEWMDQGSKGPGVYTFCTQMFAPGTWFDCREATHDMKTRAAVS